MWQTVIECMSFSYKSMLTVCHVDNCGKNCANIFCGTRIFFFFKENTNLRNTQKNILDTLLTPQIVT